MLNVCYYIETLLSSCQFVFYLLGFSVGGFRCILLLWALKTVKGENSYFFQQKHLSTLLFYFKIKLNAAPKLESLWKLI